MKFEDLEIWDYIPNFRNYKVSSRGRVFSTKHNKILKAGKYPTGYPMVILYKDKKAFSKSIHRLVADTFYYIEDFKEKQIDHIDRNIVNNNLLNLRPCTPRQNQFNHTKQKNNTTGYKGVSFNKQRNKYIAQMKLNGKQVNLGGFNTPEKAYEKYKDECKKYHGDFLCNDL